MSVCLPVGSHGSNRDFALNVLSTLPSIYICM